MEFCGVSIHSAVIVNRILEHMPLDVICKEANSGGDGHDHPHANPLEHGRSVLVEERVDHEFIYRDADDNGYSVQLGQEDIP